MRKDRLNPALETPWHEGATPALIVSSSSYSMMPLGETSDTSSIMKLEGCANMRSRSWRREEA